MRDICIQMSPYLILSISFSSHYVSTYVIKDLLVRSFRPVAGTVRSVGISLYHMIPGKIKLSNTSKFYHHEGRSYLAGEVVHNAIFDIGIKLLQCVVAKVLNWQCDS